MRARYFCKTLSLSYQDPISMVRGALQYLYDNQGKAYLDGVNNINNGMEHFYSFSGNPVSCEIGKAVLQIIQEEKLQQNAEFVGATLKSGLNKLKDKHEMIGDVRGLGLFLGIELVQDKETKDPAAALANRLVECMKERGVLLGIDGPRHNVIKIRPPLVISSGNAEFLVDQPDIVLHDLENP